MMELQVPGDTPKPLKEPDRELMSLVDAMLGQVSCSRIGPRSLLRFPFGLFFFWVPIAEGKKRNLIP